MCVARDNSHITVAGQIMNVHRVAELQTHPEVMTPVELIAHTSPFRKLQRAENINA